MTVDLEDWFHILDNPLTKYESQWGLLETRVVEETDWLLNVLKNNKVKATFFVLGYIAIRHPQVIERIVEEGHTLASHGMRHRLVYEQTLSEFERDVVEAKELIHKITGIEVSAYRAPGFSIKERNACAFSVLAKNGFTVDCSIFPAIRSHGGHPSFPSENPCIIETKSGLLKEFPISTANFFGKRMVYCGGGYFRLLPFFAVDTLLRRNTYNMTYFHPRDFDPSQPRVPGLSRWRDFKSRVGLTSARNKFQLLLQNHEFIDLPSAVSRVKWAEVPTIRV